MAMVENENVLCDFKSDFGPPDRDLSESAQARRRPPAIITCFEPRSEILHWETKNSLPLQRLEERTRVMKFIGFGPLGPPTLHSPNAPHVEGPSGGFRVRGIAHVKPCEAMLESKFD